MPELRVIACIQARMGSTRLPGKALVRIAGKTAIERIRDRLKEAHGIDKTVLVTSGEAANDQLVEHAESLGLRVWREPDEKDLVLRFLHAAEQFKADAIVRVTADCPLVDPGLVDELVAAYYAMPDEWDALTDATPPSWPDGLDLDLFPRRTLERLAREIPEGDLHREWMTPYVYKRPEAFRIFNLAAPRDLTSYRLTLDYPEDLKLLTSLFEQFGDRPVGWEEVIAYVDGHPELKTLVAHLVDTTIVQDVNMRSAAYQALLEGKESEENSKFQIPNSK